MTTKKFCDVCEKETTGVLDDNKIIFEVKEIEIRRDIQIPNKLEVCFSCIEKIKRKIKQFKEEEKIKKMEN